jgi:hypothetical protein
MVPLLAVVLSTLSAYIAYRSLTDARTVANQQAQASEPILVPSVPLAERGHSIRVATGYASVRKRADRLYLSRSTGRFIVPLQNGGSGIALTIGLPVVVENCNREPCALSRTKQALGQTLGSYVLPSGDSDQLGYVPGKDQEVHGQVQIGGHARWYTFRYQQFGRGAPYGHLLVWYTDSAERVLRWTCITYKDIPRDTHGAATEWALVAQVYGQSALPRSIRIG